MDRAAKDDQRTLEAASRSRLRLRKDRRLMLTLTLSTSDEQTCRHGSPCPLHLLS